MFIPKTVVLHIAITILFIDDLGAATCHFELEQI